MAENLDSVGQDTDFDGLPDVVTLVVHSVGQGLFDCHIGIVEETIGLCHIRQLLNTLGQHHIADILQRFPELLMQRSLESLFNNLVAAQVIRELYHIDLGIGEELLRLQAEEHQAHILGLGVLRQGADEIHIPA